jgi:hypothetical protein
MPGNFGKRNPSQFGPNEPSRPSIWGFVPERVRVAAHAEESSNTTFWMHNEDVQLFRAHFPQTNPTSANEPNEEKPNENNV